MTKSDQNSASHGSHHHSHQHHNPPAGGGHLCEEIELLKSELDNENKNRNFAQSKYSDLNRQIDVFDMCCTESKKNPESKYDTFVMKQDCLNDTLQGQIMEAKDKLSHLNQQLKSIQVCGKALCCSADCNLNMKDLYIDYNCITKGELTKEVKKFERMQIDLKSNLDRLQWRLDCESKVYYNLLDQYQKLQIELYYLQNLGERFCHKGHYMN